MPVFRIVVPLDGSSLAECTLPFAASLARLGGATLTLVRVTGAAPEAQARAADELGEIHRRLRADQIPAVSRLVALEGDYSPEAVGDTIVATAEADAAELILMSTHGRSGLGRWMYGGVANQILLSASIPVLLVKPTTSVHWPASVTEPDGRRIVVPLDGSPDAEAALRPAQRLASVLLGELILVHVLPGPVVQQGAPAGGETSVLQARTEAEYYLAQIAERLRQAGQRAQTEVAIGPVSQSIVAAAHEKEAVLIAMVAHGLGGLPEQPVGSVAIETLHRTSVPVLLVRP